MSVQHVELSEGDVEFMRRCVQEGRFKSESEVVQAGLHLLEQQEGEGRQKLEHLRAAVQKGKEDLEAGRYIEVASTEELDIFLDEIDREAQQLAGGAPHRVQATEIQ